mmetsp:Transcript_22960/g.35371  ORF Transcript_22960/g.35371 Transcript_22960/m.35371 type:complete len:266 (-) Transcript_22960:209-1006(-)|eukprot:CAMPEP_0196810998 /NCGR_PEP_ID=MMETSP1362-20130617/16203_1 /TAXON_ID=163516 /ORGANISM="Leptocylindrus danicus, Strain CCMP1856" /LENGTH=265 /DNA_ID=CAMNT_0042186219 /DNA_START=85 /DNA_END=882 /DNA_ORIENTATION=+
MKLAAVAILSAPACAAFSFVPSRANTNLMKLRMADAEGSFDFDSQPSDSSSEDLLTVDVKSEDYIPTASESLLNDIDFPDLATEVSSETRASINEALLKLEGMNPTEEPSTSNLLNGVWTLKYAGGYATEWAVPSPTRDIALFVYDGGLSPGLFALSLAQKLPSQFVDLGELKILISRDEQPRIEAKIGASVFGNESDISVKVRMDLESGMRIKETYESASAFGQTVQIPEQLKYSRELYITYLDEDLLVVRTASGVPEVLVRQR